MAGMGCRNQFSGVNQMRKIMFNDRYGLTQAVSDGRKTMTRRIIKGGYEKITEVPVLPYGSYFLAFNGDTIEGDSVDVQPLYRVREEVAVAQSYESVYLSLPEKKRRDFTIRVFMAHHEPDIHSIAGWTNKMFVRADLMPHRIRITDIKAERLQDISEEDCLREGIRESIVEFGGKKIVQWTYFHEKRTIWFDSPREAFAALIDRISGRGTWERNPWVFAYEFELIK